MALYPPVVLSVNSSLPTCGLAVTLTPFNLKTYVGANTIIMEITQKETE